MRVRKEPKTFDYSMLDSGLAFALITNTDDPRSVKEALDMEDVGSQIEAMDDEMASLDNKKTSKKKICAYGNV